MRFGEFIESNRVKGLSDGYVDYKRLTFILEKFQEEEHERLGIKNRLRTASEDDDNLRTQSVVLLNYDNQSLWSTSKSVIDKAFKRTVGAAAAVANAVEGAASGALASCKGKQEEPLCDPLLIEPREDDAFTLQQKLDTYTAFSRAMRDELVRCNGFAYHKIVEMQESVENLIDTTESILQVEISTHSAVKSFMSTPSKARDGGDSDPEGAATPERGDGMIFAAAGEVSGRRSSREEPRDDEEALKVSKFHSPTKKFSSQMLSDNHTMQHAYKETHMLALQLKQMMTVNLTGFLKAAKKCKKVTGHQVIVDFPKETCCNPTALNMIADRLISNFANHFSDGNVHRAEAQLMMYKPTMRPSLKVGFFLGMDMCMTLFLFWVMMFSPAHSDCPYCMKSFLEAIPVFRIVLIPLLFIWCWSAITYVFRSYGINYVWILDINPRREIGVLGAASLAATLTILFLGSMTLFLAGIKTGYLLLGIPLFWYPLALLVTSILITVAPPGMFYFKSRWWFFQTLVIILQKIVAPLGPEVRFRENYVADVLTSMAAWLVDISTVFGFYYSGNAFHPGTSQVDPTKIPVAHFVTALPYWFRIQQCLRRYMDTHDGWHLVNAGKYLMSLGSICLAAVGNYVKLDGTWSIGKCTWLSLLCFATLYAYLWDICMDWGLVSRRGVRRQLGFNDKKWFYCFAAVSNFIGRLGWALSITPHSLIPGLGKQVSTTIVATVEILRRCQWTLLRIEWEFIGNPAKYRSISQVPILLTFESEKEQIHPMRATILGGLNTLLVACVVIVAYVHYKAMGHQ